MPAVHADAILVLANLMTAADGRLGDDEIEAYRDVVEKVCGKAPTAHHRGGVRRSAAALARPKR